MTENTQSATDASPSATQKLSQDALIKFVFDNLRNVIICASIMATSSAARHLQGKLSLYPSFNHLIAFILAIFSIVLLTWNLIHGVTTIARQFQMNRWALTLIAMPLMGIYMYLMWVVLTTTLQIQLHNLQQ